MRKIGPRQSREIRPRRGQANEHVTIVIVQRRSAGAAAAELAGPAWVCLDDERIARLSNVLAALGFNLRVYGPRIFAESPDVSVSDARHRIVAAGFEDREFRTVVEHRPRWRGA